MIQGRVPVVITISLPTLQITYYQDGHIILTTGICRLHYKITYSSDDLICSRRAHNTRTDTRRDDSKSTYSSDDLIAGRAHIILTTDTHRHHSKSTYSSDDLLAGRTAIILTTGARRRHCKSTYSSDDL
jgi:hypothetical protein